MTGGLRPSWHHPPLSNRTKTEHGHRGTHTPPIHITYITYSAPTNSPIHDLIFSRIRQSSWAYGTPLQLDTITDSAHVLEELRRSSEHSINLHPSNQSKHIQTIFEHVHHSFKEIQPMKKDPLWAGSPNVVHVPPRAARSGPRASGWQLPSALLRRIDPFGSTSDVRWSGRRCTPHLDYKGLSQIDKPGDSAWD